MASINLRIGLKSSSRVHTPAVLQLEAVECGAAALAAVLGFYKRFVPLAELRRECGVSRDGSKASSLIKAARRYGLQAKGLTRQSDELAKIKAPFIIFWNFNHFVTYEGCHKEKVYVNDPAVGHRTITREEFDRCFTGVVLAMEPGPEFIPGGKLPGLWPAIIERLAGSFGPALYCFLAGLFLVIPGLAIPAFNQVFIDSIILGGRVDWLRPLILAMAIALVTQGLLHFLQLRYLRRLKIKLAMNMSSKYIWHMLTLPISFYQQRFAGEIANRSELNDKLASLMSGELAQTAIGVVMMGFFALVMFSYDVLLTGIGVSFAAINFVVLKLVSKRRIELNMRVLSEMGKTYGTAIAGLNSIETIKASGLEDDFFQKFGGYFAKGTNAAQALQLSNLVLVILPSLLLGLTTASILVVGAFRVINGDLTIGMLVAFQSLMTSFLMPITELSNLGQKFQELRGDLNRVDDVIKYPTPEPIAKRELKDSAGNPIIRLDGKIDLVNVTFGHSPVAKAFFKGIDLTVRPGAAVALVGSSGSGKSTLARLICGDYALWDGQILFDDIPRDEIAEQVLASSFSVVDQEVSLFAATVRENLTLWDQTVSNGRLRAACDDASILEVVDNLRNGFNSDILEGGANLSGGQRQRLEIARALVSQPSIIVLDEATSALDAETESVVMERLRMRGCTAIIVAHRLSTVRDADQILVLSRGKIIERGTHDELWELNGEYARLMRADEAS